MSFINYGWILEINTFKSQFLELLKEKNVVVTRLSKYKKKILRYSVINT